MIVGHESECIHVNDLEVGTADPREKMHHEAICIGLENVMVSLAKKFDNSGNRET
jgi:hypothetical protein